MFACEPNTEHISYTSLGIGASNTAGSLSRVMLGGDPDLESRNSWEGMRTFLANGLLKLTPLGDLKVTGTRTLLEAYAESDVFWQVVDLWVKIRGGTIIGDPDDVDTWKELVNRLKSPIDYLLGEASDRPSLDQLQLSRDFCRQVAGYCLGKVSRQSCKPFNDD